MMRGEYWIFIAAVLFIISLILHQIPLLLISLLLVLARGISKIWERYCLDRVEYHQKLSSNRVFYGEEVQLEVEVANRKPLPLPWIEITHEVPAEVTFLRGGTYPSYKYTRMQLTCLLSLGWYHRVKRRYPIRCLQRGCFAFGPIRICSGDLFGFSQREMEIQQVEYLTVYPKIVPLEKLSIPSNQIMGDIRARRYIFQDPILSMGVRDYQPGDSLKKIHWRTTARHGQLQTKVFEPTTTVDMGIFLDIRTVKPPAWGQVTQLLELGIIAAASLANCAMEAGYRVGLYINQWRRFSGGAITIPPSQHPDQLMLILEALAQIPNSFETMPIAKLISSEGRNLPWGSTVVVITATPTGDLFAVLVNMKRLGRKVALVLVGDSDAGISKDGLDVYRIPSDVAWHELEKLDMQGRNQ